MAITDLYRPGHLIRRAQQIAYALFMEECAGHGLTPVQYASLIALREKPGIDATRLAAMIAFDRSTTGDVLERLEKKRLIARTASPNDRRVKLLRLTRAGRTLIDAAEPAVDRCQQRILEPLAPADRTQFMHVLHQLVKLNDESARRPSKTRTDLKIVKRR
ncbi:MAG TPA: MarR family transcriptional regulator [Vicinamibacterales bacterium]